MEFGSSVLNDIAGLYNAPDATAFQTKVVALSAKFARVESELGNGPWFAGSVFSLVDAVFAPVFRYFDVLDQIGEFGILDGLPKVQTWREQLASRPSVRTAVSPEYPDNLRDFFRNRKSHLSSLMSESAVQV